MTSRKSNIIVVLLAVLLALGLNMSVVGTAAAQTIPDGATIDSATLWVYAFGDAHDQMVNVHQVTADWQEDIVTWNSFADSYVGAVEGSFVVDALGWHSVDVTALVQDWVDGVEPNFGILLESDADPTRFSTSENILDPFPPMLEVDYNTSFSVTIQRPGGNVPDTYISEQETGLNKGTSIAMWVGTVGVLRKQALIRFDFTTEPGEECGTGTPGYWKNHPKAWPVEVIGIGGLLYTKAEAIKIMKTSGGDKTLTMFRALVSAKLNVLNGCKSCCVIDTIADADDWMADHPAGSGVKAGGKKSPWRDGESLAKKLDDYNNGLLCAPHRDSLE